MNLPSKNLTIGLLAQNAGVNVETVRFYQRKGLLREPSRPTGGVRRYGAVDLNRLGFIKSAQRLGFSLNEVAQLLNLEDGTHCDEAREQAQRKLIDVRVKLKDLLGIESALSAMIVQCDATMGNLRCPLIATLQGAN